MKPKDYNKKLVAWAKKALHGLDDSSVFVGIMSDKPMDAARIEFLLHIGHCVVVGKPIIITVPHGVEIPAKLQAVADRIVRFTAGDQESLANALKPVLAEMGVNKQ